MEIIGRNQNYATLRNQRRLRKNGKKVKVKETSTQQTTKTSMQAVYGQQEPQLMILN